MAGVTANLLPDCGLGFLVAADLLNLSNEMVYEWVTLGVDLGERFVCAWVGV